MRVTPALKWARLHVRTLNAVAVKDAKMQERMLSTCRKCRTGLAHAIPGAVFGIVHAARRGLGVWALCVRLGMQCMFKLRGRLSLVYSMTMTVTQEAEHLQLARQLRVTSCCAHVPRSKPRAVCSATAASQLANTAHLSTHNWMQGV